MKKYDIAIVIGRFQPFHNGHLQLLAKAAEVADHTLVMFGSSSRASDQRNPFTDQQRRKMLDLLVEKGLSQKNTYSRWLVDDLYDNDAWRRQLENNVKDFCKFHNYEYDRARIVIVGHKKADVIYLDWFEQWAKIETKNYNSIDATSIREFIYSRANGNFHLTPQAAYHWLSERMPKCVLDYIASKECDETLANAAAEEAWLQKHNEIYAKNPYRPYFITVDACVVSKGHILLIKRKARPGKGLYALPGGYLEYEEDIFDSMIREVDEETGVKVALDQMKTYKEFGHPKRSLRGRVVTFCGYFHVQKNENEPLPEIAILDNETGAGEVSKAVWVPIPDFYNMSHKMFEDHYSIGCKMLRLGGNQ